MKRFGILGLGIFLSAGAFAKELNTCIAIRGNGQRLFAHYGAIARHLETIGPVDAIAGGSSGSITSFLYESAFANPWVHQCFDGPCQNRSRGQRLSLLFKSIIGYLEVAAESPEAIAYQVLSRAAQEISSLNLTDSDLEVEKLRQSVLTIINSKDVRDLVNPELINLLKTSKAPLYHLRETIRAAREFGQFQAADPSVLFWPGFFNMKAFAQITGRIGSFLAAYDPVDQRGMNTYLNRCAEKTVGMDWQQIAIQQPDCASQLKSLVHSFRSTLLANEKQYPKRINDPIGWFLPAFVLTGIVATDEAVDEVRQGFKDYQEGRTITINDRETVAFDIPFSAVKFGYWGAENDLAKIERNPMGYSDLKTQKYLSLGRESWLKAITLSTSEPGLVSAKPYGRYYSVGGWSDPTPVQILKNLGCEHVYQVTRWVDEKEEGYFSAAMGRLLGMSEKEYYELYAPNRLEGLENALHGANEESAGIWCVDWDAPVSGDPATLFSVGYQNQLYLDTAQVDFPISMDLNWQKHLGSKTCTR